MNVGGFFEESREQSRIKSLIVEKYFSSWARIIVGQIKKYEHEGDAGRLAYVDLFAGPGRYEDGTESTPLMIVRRAAGDPNLRDRLVIVFNDANREFAEALRQELEEMPEAAELKYRPRVHHEEVGERVAKMLGSINMVPTFGFVDPWGYKGVTRDLLQGLLKDWGSECVLFFNYNRINMAINNPSVEEHMDALFGEGRANDLRERVKTADPVTREMLVLDALRETFEELGAKYVLPFRFRREDGVRTSHHLVFASKHPRGYAIMKDIMAQFAPGSAPGSPSFEYNPVDERFPRLFRYAMEQEELEEGLLETFAGMTLTVEEIFDKHQGGSLYRKKDYKAALLKLEAEGRIVAHPPAEKRRKRKGAPTMADWVRVEFPSRGA